MPETTEACRGCGGPITQQYREQLTHCSNQCRAHKWCAVGTPEVKEIEAEARSETQGIIYGRD
jgi:hypothetical protein